MFIWSVYLVKRVITAVEEYGGLVTHCLRNSNTLSRRTLHCRTRCRLIEADTSNASSISLHCLLHLCIQCMCSVYPLSVRERDVSMLYLLDRLGYLHWNKKAPLTHKWHLALEWSVCLWPSAVGYWMALHYHLAANKSQSFSVSNHTGKIVHHSTMTKLTDHEMKCHWKYSLQDVHGN